MALHHEPQPTEIRTPRIIGAPATCMVEDTSGKAEAMRYSQLASGHSYRKSVDDLSGRTTSQHDERECAACHPHHAISRLVRKVIVDGFGYTTTAPERDRTTDHVVSHYTALWASAQDEVRSCGQATTWGMR